MTSSPSWAASLPTAFPTTTCLRRGLCPVTSIRSQGPEALESHSLYYEQHGPPSAKNDPAAQAALAKVVFVMGLNSSSFSWGPQVRWFGREGGRCTALVFDNRGVGNSGYPRGPYTTSGMAEDVICLLDYLGWTGERELTIVGISLGGMIAQELAYRIPHRINSLVLAVTTPGGPIYNNFPPTKGLTSLAKLIFTPDPVDKVPIVLEMLFPTAWLALRADSDPHAEFNDNTEDNAQGKTNRDVQAEGFLRRVAITKPQFFMGHISQMAAGLTHYMSDERLAQVARTVPKTAIVTGDDDHLVRPSGSVRIMRAMEAGISGEPKTNVDGVEKRLEMMMWEGTGHGIHAQREKRFNELVERCVFEGKKLVESGWVPKHV